MTRTRTLLAALIAVVVGALAAGGVSAAGGPEDESGSLVGSWIVSVDRGALGPLTSLVTYTEGHGSVETANAGATLRTASHGVWQRVAPRRFEATSMFFRLDATGAFVGTVNLRIAIELDSDGNSFSGVAVPELRDQNGNLLPGSNSRRDSIFGTRMTVEPIPG
jgi:hypothetical protein